MAVAEATPDSLQVLAAEAAATLRWPLVEQLRELHPPIEIVERCYGCQNPIRHMVVMNWFVASSGSEPL
eukprot:6561930-Pyramimonas_sp.AAC.1